MSVNVLRSALLPVVVGVVSVVVSLYCVNGAPPDALGVALLLVGPVALLARDRAPLGVVGIAATAAGIYLAAGYTYGPVLLATVVAMGGAVLRGLATRAVVVGTLSFLVLFVLHLARFDFDLAQVPWLAVAAWVPSVAAVLAGCAWWRLRSERRAQERAAIRETARRQVSEERLRIARDLHDSLGHHLSLINVQAGVAHTLFDRDPEQARRALATITTASRELLVEMRSTLGVLRGVDEAPSRHPVPGLDGLPALATSSRAAGLDVRLDVPDDLRLSPSIDHAVYRITQEALTNVRRHAGAAEARVRVRPHADALEIEVVDDGPGPGADPVAPTDAGDPAGTGSGDSTGSGGSGGDGIPGMRERAHALGGYLDAGRRPGGGFRVHARLPLVTAASEPDVLVGELR